eukprot:UN06490
MNVNNFMLVLVLYFIVPYLLIGSKFHIPPSLTLAHSSLPI